MASATWESNPWVWCLGFRRVQEGAGAWAGREVPILFRGEMVRAILEGRKTQTRRVLKPKLADWMRWLSDEDNGDRPALGFSEEGHSGPGWYVHSDNYPDKGSVCLTCPYGKPGDRLWVRETWKAPIRFDLVAPRDIPVGTPITFQADASGGGWENVGRLRPSLHLMRWMARLVLEVTDVRVERLQDISEEDAKAEGAFTEGLIAQRAWPERGAVKWFRALWESLHG